MHGEARDKTPIRHDERCKIVNESEVYHEVMITLTDHNTFESSTIYTQLDVNAVRIRVLGLLTVQEGGPFKSRVCFLIQIRDPSPSLPFEIGIVQVILLVR